MAIAVSLSSFAQNEDAFHKGSNALNVGLGFGNPYWGAGYGTTGLPFSLHTSLDHGITEKVGIGYVAIGGQLSYATAKYSYYDEVAWRSTGILIAARGSYHFAIPSSIGSKLDPYAGVLLGYVIAKYSYNDGYGNSGVIGKSGGVAMGIFAGARYSLGEHFGVYGELGYTSFSILNLGVAIKF